MSIEVKEVTHIYSENLPYQSIALDSVSFEVSDGEFMGIIGHTGSGKSTLVRHLNGLLKPKSGKIIINGTDITQEKINMRDIRRKVGLVFQYPEYQLFEESVYKDVAFGPTNLGLSKEEVHMCVQEAIEMVGLDFSEIKDRSPFELSGGQKRRAAIAGVISMKPEILILDEPTAGLDPKTHKEILRMIKDIHRLTGNITILISHNMSDIAEHCGRIIVLEKGRLLMQGTAYEVFKNREALAETGLDIPPVTELLHRLAGCGLNVETGIFDPGAAAEEIARAIKDRSRI